MSVSAKALQKLATDLQWHGRLRAYAAYSLEKRAGLADGAARLLGAAVDAPVGGMARTLWGGLGKAVGGGLRGTAAAGEGAGRGLVGLVSKHPMASLGVAGIGYHLFGPQSGGLNTVNEFVNFAPNMMADQASTVVNPYGQKSQEEGRGLSPKAMAAQNAPVAINNPLTQPKDPNVVYPNVPGYQG